MCRTGGRRCNGASTSKDAAAARKRRQRERAANASTPAEGAAGDQAPTAGTTDTGDTGDVTYTNNVVVGGNAHVGTVIGTNISFGSNETPDNGQRNAGQPTEKGRGTARQRPPSPADQRAADMLSGNVPAGDDLSPEQRAYVDAQRAAHKARRSEWAGSVAEFLAARSSAADPKPTPHGQGTRVGGTGDVTGNNNVVINGATGSVHISRTGGPAAAGQSPSYRVAMQAGKAARKAARRAGRNDEASAARHGRNRGDVTGDGNLTITGTGRVSFGDDHTDDGSDDFGWGA